MDYIFKRGTTSKSVSVFLSDPITRAPKTGLVYSGVTGKYVSPGSATASISMATLASVSVAYSSGGFIELDATNFPGHYRFDIPNAILALSGDNVEISFTDGSGNYYGGMSIQIVSFDPQDAAAIGLTNLDAAVSTRLPTSGYTSPPSAATNAAAVVDQALSGHTTSGTAGAALAHLNADVADVYWAKVQFTRDQTNAQDEYTVCWFKNGVAATATVPTIQVVKRADGSNLIASASMTQIGSTGWFKYDATTTERQTLGDAVIVVVTATIDGVTRTFSQPLGRDA